MSDDLTTRVAPHAPTPGSAIGPWRVLERVDSGTFGVVFRAQRADSPESPSVALKLARYDSDPRFEREAELLRRVQHPNVPRYEASGSWLSAQGEHYPYVVMEWVEGSTLYDWFKEQPRSSREVLRLLAQVARGLEAVHAQGAFHRDVKGDNIRVTPEGRAVLVDFGACWLPGARPITDTPAPPGTPPYRAPELLRFMWRSRREREARWPPRPFDDLYALGVTAYRLVTGTYPPSETEEDEPPRKLLRPRELATVAKELESIILRLLSKESDARGTAAEIARSLEREAQRAGTDADEPIRPIPVASPRPSPDPRRRVARTAFFRWLALVSAATVGGLLALVLARLWHWGAELWHSRGEPEAPPPLLTEAWHPPHIETPDAGVADEALTSAQASPVVGVPLNLVGRQMPKTPLPNQRKPPCAARGERMINGGCWVLVGEEKPPCGPTMYDYEEGCYYASYDAPRQPASDEP